MSLVVDTNVLVSAFLWQGIPGRLIELVAQKEIELATGHRGRVKSLFSPPDCRRP